MKKLNKIYFFLATFIIAFNSKLVYAAVDCDKPFTGDNVCDNTCFTDFVNQIYGYVKITIPILILLLGTMDFAKAIIGQKDDDLKKAQATFFKRLIIGVIIFFAPIIVGVIVSLLNGKLGTCNIK